MKEVKTQSILNDINILIDKAEKYDELKETMRTIDEIKQLAQRYYAKVLTVPVIAFLNDVNEDTVRKYIKLGLIPLHPKSTDSKLLVRASDAIVLDFTEMKKQSKTVRL